MTAATISRQDAPLTDTPDVTPLGGPSGGEDQAGAMWTREESNPPPELAQAALAYENPAFLESSEGRPLRILAEYAEPMARFRQQRIEDTVVFFGSARFRSMEEAGAELERVQRDAAEPGETAAAEADALRHARAMVEMAQFYEDARVLARQHATWALSLPGPRHRFVVTSGGGPGIMEAANRGAWEAGARTIGLNITLPFEQKPNRWITPELNFNFHYFFMRKFWFASLAKALVIFPGGFGTLDEAFELLTLAQTGTLQKKLVIVLYGRSYWEGVLNLEVMAKHGAIAVRDLKLFQYADTPEEAFALLQAGLLPVSRPVEETVEPAPPATPAPSPQQILGPDIARSR